MIAMLERIQSILFIKSRVNAVMSWQTAMVKWLWREKRNCSKRDARPKGHRTTDQGGKLVSWRICSGITKISIKSRIGDRCVLCCFETGIDTLDSQKSSKILTISENIKSNHKVINIHTLDSFSQERWIINFLILPAKQLLGFPKPLKIPRKPKAGCFESITPWCQSHVATCSK